jgi:predicted nucleotidyltransferase
MREKLTAKEMDKEAIIQQLRQYFASQEEVLLAFLFGSWNKNRTLSESDVDVAIWLRDPYGQEEMNRIWRDLENLLQVPVDLLLLNRASPTIAWAALKGSTIVIRDQGFYLEYMLETSREAEDFQDFLFDLWQWRERIRKQRSYSGDHPG